MTIHHRHRLSNAAAAAHRHSRFDVIFPFLASSSSGGGGGGVGGGLGNCRSSSKRWLWFLLVCGMALSSVVVSVLQARQAVQPHQQQQQQQNHAANYEFRLLMPQGSSGNLRSNSNNDNKVPVLGVRSSLATRVTYLEPSPQTNGTSSTASAGNATTTPKQQKTRQLHTSQQPLTTQSYPIRMANASTSSSGVRLYDQTRYYAHGDSEDFQGMERRSWPEHPDADQKGSCEPMQEWQSMQYPVCNSVHEMDWRSNVAAGGRSGNDGGGGLLKILSGNGFWRHAWKYEENVRVEWNGTTPIVRSSSNVTNGNTPTTVWKTFKLQHDMEEAFFENNRVDALAMERLTHSPYVIDLYAFCGMTVVTEYAGKETATVANKLNTTTQKLEMAYKISQGLADIHSIDGEENRPSLAHNDINLGNLVFSDDDRPLWNDFNIAILLMKDRNTGETCPFRSHFPNPQWRSPEEQVYSEEESDAKPPVVTEKVDLYGLGNVFYRLAVGASPWKKPGTKSLTPEEKSEVAWLKRSNGTLPLVPEEIRNTTDPAIQTLLEAMHLAYEFDPIKRPNATYIASFLKNRLDKIELAPVPAPPAARGKGSSPAAAKTA